MAGEGTAPQGESSESRPQDVLWESGDEDTERDKTLLVPEFPGLWSQEYDLHKVNVVISRVRNRKEPCLKPIIVYFAVKMQTLCYYIDAEIQMW